MNYPRLITGIVLAEISAERQHQDTKWGGKDHDDEHNYADWLDLINSRLYAQKHAGSLIRHSLIEIAALAVAAIESFDRQSQTLEGRE